jgi:hypothetical protein
MIYSISNKQYNVCFNISNRAIDIGTTNLDINKFLYKNNNTTPWKWSEVIALDATFIGSISLYLRTGESYDIIQIKQDINTGNAIVIQTVGICPTQTPTPTLTPSNSSTPTVTPTNTTTPSQTVTNTPTSTSPLARFLYYISADLETLCYIDMQIWSKQLVCMTQIVVYRLHLTYIKIVQVLQNGIIVNL